MKVEDYYDLVRDKQPCSQLGTVIKLITIDYDIFQMDLMVLLELHGVGEFTWDDFATAQLTSSWNKKRFYMFKDNGWVDLYRAKDRKFQKYNIYKPTRKCTTMVRAFYDYLSGKTPLPDRAFSSRERYRSNRLTVKINKLKQNDD